jgi:hypothetical protein
MDAMAMRYAAVVLGKANPLVKKLQSTIMQSKDAPTPAPTDFFRSAVKCLKELQQLAAHAEAGATKPDLSNALDMDNALQVVQRANKVEGALKDVLKTLSRVRG